MIGNVKYSIFPIIASAAIALSFEIVLILSFVAFKIILKRNSQVYFASEFIGIFVITVLLDVLTRSARIKNLIQKGEGT